MGPDRILRVEAKLGQPPQGFQPGTFFINGAKLSREQKRDVKSHLMKQHNRRSKNAKKQELQEVREIEVSRAFQAKALARINSNTFHEPFGDSVFYLDSHSQVQLWRCMFHV